MIDDRDIVVGIVDLQIGILIEIIQDQLRIVFFARRFSVKVTITATRIDNTAVSKIITVTIYKKDTLIIIKTSITIYNFKTNTVF